MPNRLMDFEMDEGSLVDKGAHPGAKVLIYKRDDTEKDMPNSPASGDLFAEGTLGAKKAKDEEEIRSKRPSKRFTTKEQQEGNVREDETTSDDEDEDMPDNKRKKDEDIAKGLDPEVASYITELESYADTLEGEVAKRDEALADVAKNDDEDTDPEEVLKSADPAIREMFEEVRKQAEADRERLEEVEKREARREDERLTAEFEGVAKSFHHIPVDMDAAEFGEVLKSLHKADADNFEKVRKVLDAADNALATNDYLFTEVGKHGGNGDSGFGDKAEAKAQELVSKSDGSMSIEEARVRVLDENPELYDATQQPGR